jgi:hypothetical protein
VDAPAIIVTKLVMTTVALPSTTEPALEYPRITAGKNDCSDLEDTRSTLTLLLMHYFTFISAPGSASGLYTFFLEYDNYDVAPTR